MAKVTKRSPYTVEVIGEAETVFRGPRPEKPELLTDKPDRTHQSLINKIAKAQIESCLQAGEVEGAWKVLNKWHEDANVYSNHINVFQKDRQNGDIPFIGAHAFVGAMRDATSWLWDCFFESKEGKKKNLSSKHFRKSMYIKPHHIFFYRPNLDGKIITEADRITCQQPTTGVGGFARNEEIDPPFQFRFWVVINPAAQYNGGFQKILNDPDKVYQMINQATIHGLGAGRGIGCGMWKIISMKMRNGIVFEEPKLSLVA